MRFQRLWLLAINTFTFSPGEVPSATPQALALQLDLRHVSRSPVLGANYLELVLNCPQNGTTVVTGAMGAIKRHCRVLSIEYFSLLPEISGVYEIPVIKRRARRIFFVAAESTICTYLIQKKIFVLVVQYACIVASSTSLSLGS